MQRKLFLINRIVRLPHKISISQLAESINSFSISLGPNEYRHSQTEIWRNLSMLVV